MKCFVYIIGVGDEWTKVGIATDVKRRCSELQTGNPLELTVQAQFEWPSVSEARNNEWWFRREAAKALKGSISLVSTEWVRAPAPLVADHWRVVYRGKWRKAWGEPPPKRPISPSWWKLEGYTSRQAAEEAIRMRPKDVVISELCERMGL